MCSVPDVCDQLQGLAQESSSTFLARTTDMTGRACLALADDLTHLAEPPPG